MADALPLSHREISRGDQSISRVCWGPGFDSRLERLRFFSVSAKASLPISLSLSPFPPLPFPSSSFPFLFLSLSFSHRLFVCAKKRVFAFTPLTLSLCSGKTNQNTQLNIKKFAPQCSLMTHAISRESANHFSFQTFACFAQLLKFVWAFPLRLSSLQTIIFFFFFQKRQEQKRGEAHIRMLEFRDSFPAREVCVHMLDKTRKEQAFNS